MDLTTAARVKRLAGYATPDSAHDDDTLIGRIITAVSRQVEHYLNRDLLIAARTVYFDAEDGQRDFYLRAFPVSAVATIKNDLAREFASGSEFASTNYAVYGSTGRIGIDRLTIRGGARVVQVVYTGGIAATAAALVADADYADLVLAVEIQCAYLLKWKAHMGLSGVSTAGGNAQFKQGGGFGGKSEEALDLIPEVKGLLERYRRIPMGEEEST